MEMEIYNGKKLSSQQDLRHFGFETAMHPAKFSGGQQAPLNAGNHLTDCASQKASVSTLSDILPEGVTPPEFTPV
jgi:hypothetical protein